MSATTLYLLSTKNDPSANPVHILTNGTRTYTNSQIYRKDNLVGAVTGTQTPPGNSDIYYSAGVGTSGPRASEVTGGNGYIVFIY